MRIVVGVTDNRWAAFLRDHDDITEANFWQPSPHGFKALSPGEPFLFKTKDPKKFKGLDIPGYHLVGGGFFDEYVELRVSEAWTIWGAANGVSSEAELLSRAQAYRARARASPQAVPLTDARSRPEHRRGLTGAVHTLGFGLSRSSRATVRNTAKRKTTVRADARSESLKGVISRCGSPSAITNTRPAAPATLQVQRENEAFRNDCTIST